MSTRAGKNSRDNTLNLRFPEISFDISFVRSILALLVMFTRAILAVFTSGNKPMPSSLVNWQRINTKTLTAVIADVPTDQIALAVAASCHPKFLDKFLRKSGIQAFRTIIHRDAIRVEGRISVTVSGKADDRYHLWSCIISRQRVLHVPTGFYSNFGATVEVTVAGQKSPRCVICGIKFWGGDECHGCIMRQV